MYIKFKYILPSIFSFHNYQLVTILAIGLTSIMLSPVLICFNLGKGSKKKEKSDIYHFGEGGVSEGQLSLSIFFVPNALKIISRH